MNRMPFRTTLRARFRWSILIVTVIIAATVGGVTFAQSSLNFDLACRGTISVAGGVSSLPNNGIILVGSLGQPVAGISQGTTVGIKAGYVQPIAPGTAVTAASADAPATAKPRASLENEASGTIYLPALYTTVSRYVRPCNW